MIFSNEQFNILISTIKQGFEYIGERVSTTNSKTNTCSVLYFDWLDTWFQTYRVPKLKDKGYDLKNLINKHVKPKIENKPLTEYKPIDFENALNKINSTRIKQQVRQVYNQSFRNAEKQGYIDKNPVSLVDTPKHVYKNGKALSKEQVEELLKALEHKYYKSLIQFCLYTGARPSEPLSITWKDVYEDSIHIPGTKTKLSDRVIPMSNQLKELLKTIPRDQEYLFPYNYLPVQRDFKKVVAKLSFTCTLKDLRHTFASNCNENNVNIKVAQKWLGHSNFNTTANIYTHTSKEFELEELKKIE